MKSLLSVILIFGSFSVQAMTITEKDVVGQYKVDAEPETKSEAEILIEKNKKFVVTMGKKKFEGNWSIKNNELHLKSGKNECDMHYKPDLSFASGADVGNGLSCVDSKKAAKVNFCFCLWEKLPNT